MEKRDGGRGSEERKGKSQREREEKVLPRNHAPRTPTDFYGSRTGEGKLTGRQSAPDLPLPFVSLLLFLLFSSKQGGNACTYVRTRRAEFPPLGGMSRSCGHARATLRLPYHREDSGKRPIKTEINLLESGTMRSSYDSTRARGRPRLCVVVVVVIVCSSMHIRRMQRERASRSIKRQPSVWWPRIISALHSLFFPRAASRVSKEERPSCTSVCLPLQTAFLNGRNKIKHRFSYIANPPYALNTEVPAHLFKHNIFYINLFSILIYHKNWILYESLLRALLRKLMKIIATKFEPPVDHRQDVFHFARIGHF